MATEAIAGGLPTLEAGDDGALPRQRLLRWIARMLEACAGAYGFFLLSQAVIVLLLHGSADVQDRTPPLLIERLAWWAFYAYTVSWWALRPRRLVHTAMVNPFVPAVVVVALLSAMWSIAPQETAHHVLVLFMSTLFGMHIGSRYGIPQQLRLLAVVLGAIAVLSLAFGLFLPDDGIATGTYAGAWQGVFTQKNQLGMAMLLAAVVSRLLPNRRAWGRIASWGTTALAVTLLWLSRSMTNIMILGVLVVATPLVGLLRRGHPKSVVLLFALCCAVTVPLMIAMANRDLVLSHFGRDVTLTGRTQIWSTVIDRIARRPVLGYGYGAFWNSEAGEGARAAIGWDTPHSHNGFLDLWLDFGLVGFAAFGTGFVLAMRRAWIAMRANPGRVSLWPMVFLIAFFLGNITETNGTQNPFIWAICVSIAASLSAKRVAVWESTSARAEHPRGLED